MPDQETRHAGCDRHPIEMAVSRCDRCGRSCCEGCELAAAGRSLCIDCGVEMAGVRTRRRRTR